MQQHIVGVIELRTITRAISLLAIPAMLLSLTTDSQAQDADWSGWYVGGGLAYYTADLEEREFGLSDGQLDAIYDYEGDGVAAVIYGGRNWQRDRFLYGFELGLQTGESVADVDNTPGGNQFFYDTSLMVSIEAKTGYLVTPRTNVFASFGVSAGYLYYDWTVGGTREVGRTMSRGLVAGFGVEHRLQNDGALMVSVDYTAREADDFSPDLNSIDFFDNTLEQVQLTVGYTFFLGD